MTIDVIKSLIWYCNGQGVANPLIAVEQDGNTVKIVTWNCGTVPQPTTEEIATIDTNYKATQDYFSSIFDPIAFQGQLNDAYSDGDAIALAPYFAAIIGYANWSPRNFTGMKTFAEGLVSAEIMTEAQYTTLKTVLLLQGIDLTKW